MGTLKESVKSKMQGFQKLIKKKMKKKLSNKNIRREAKKILKQSKDDWLPENFRISDAWAMRIHEELLARSKEVKFQRKMKPFGAWALQKLEEEGKISNDDAKKKYTEVVGEIKTRNSGKTLEQTCEENWALTAYSWKSTARNSTIGYQRTTEQNYTTIKQMFANATNFCRKKAYLHTKYISELEGEKVRGGVK